MAQYVDHSVEFPGEHFIISSSSSTNIIYSTTTSYAPNTHQSIIIITWLYAKEDPNGRGPAADVPVS
jgi:hypothetical protein